ncbi:family 78 glycoside hydrolase catalytic domain [Sunxiuqinia rutila]|uniref:family 78 glycoside hydrolase catalytic domain n=1 Tax=Sunxiuqinia rutila TaxID=1397841 RepID=UPI003D36ABD9
MNKPNFSCCTLKWILYPLILSVLFLTGCSSDEVQLTDLRCEYLKNPVGIDKQHPRFSWKILSEERGVYQQSYSIFVDESLEELEQGKGKQWQSGQVESGQTVNVAYQGAPLKSNQTYYWRVRVQTKQGKTCWSEPATFHTGLLDAEDWQAQWITTREDIADASPIFRKEFHIEKKVKQAYAFVTACGFYEFLLNGQKVGDHVLDPAVTDYRKTILYSTYNVTEFLQEGTNVSGVMLGSGAYNLRQTEGRYSWGNGGSRLGNPCFIVQLNLTFEDGSQQVLVSDDSWKYAPGPITFNNIYGGEDYNALLEVDGWATDEINAENWSLARIAEAPGGKLVAQSLPPIQVTQTILPITATQVADGVYLFDLGQNIAGWWRLEVRGKKGQTIRVRGSETLNDELFPKPLEAGDRLSEKFRYHAQNWTDYTLKGGEDETYEPRFFYTGFRYIEVATNDGSTLDKLKVEGRVVRSALERNGSFTSSDSLLNQIHEAGLWSQMGNTVGYPTDCPHREKGAYNGDGQVIAETSIHDFQMAPFFNKWLNDMRDAQEENGRIPNTSPTLIGGMGGGVAWGSAYILIPYWMNRYYNDVQILEEHYPTMKKYLEYLIELAQTDSNPEEPYIINDFLGYWYSLGEWCAPGQRDGPNHPVVNTFYFYYNAKLFSEIGQLLGNTDDAQRFAGLSDTIKQAFNQKFFNPETALYGTDSTYQTYQLLALHGNLVSEQYKEDVFRTIVDDLHARNKHLNTGIIGTKYLWPILEQGNQTDLAYEVAIQKTYPSFGYWLENHSTTLLEDFEGENSHNHQMFGSVVEYFYKYLAGIQSPLEGNTSKGYRHVYLSPSVPEGLTHVSASQETVAGTIVSSWEKSSNQFRYQVTIPANSTGTVALPIRGSEEIRVTESQSLIWENGNYQPGVEGIRKVTKTGNKFVVELESGSYHFELSGQ